MRASDENVASFIERWRRSGGAERANYVMFLTELCTLLDLPGPEPARDDGTTDYRFEYPVRLRDDDGKASTGRIDLYKRHCFVLEAKQGTDQKLQQELPLFGLSGNARAGSAVKRGTEMHRLAMQRARKQAEGYAKALPTSHGWPPFLLVVDVGHSIECFADFSLTGKSYSQFPDASSFRIGLDDLADPGIRARLATIWTEPMSLDPAKISARVTKEIAGDLAQLAKLLEHKGYRPESVAQFLMRCLFTMFAEDVRLLPEGCFLKLLEEIVASDDPKRFKRQMEAFWGVMNKGGFEPWLGRNILRFNGGLFAEPEALDLDREEIGVLRKAARRDWQDVEPAIFGTLLERALDARERHKLGAHFTPRAYVERLVMPTVIEPLREDWANVQGSAMLLTARGDTKAALDEVLAFHRQLCSIRVLDPACGSGNFLYVTMEHMKRLEGEVIELARNLGQDQYFLELDRHTVDPHQFLGIELNPRAAIIAELVLWIGYLQWHFRTRGSVMPVQPVLKNFKNIECRDAILEWDEEEIVRDAQGKPLTRWDGHTMKTHPVTGRAVPDETAREPVMRYVDPRAARWPEAEFIVGNPPFQGGKDLRDVLGDHYAEALRTAHKDMPGSADLVMYWWDQAARLTRHGKLRRFGLITTNSLPQVFNRRVVERHLADVKKPLSLAFAIPDHPWVDEAGGANVRIAMTVGVAGRQEGRLQQVVDPMLKPGQGGDRLRPPIDGKIAANLRLGADLTSVRPLRANEGLCSPGVKLHGSGFIVTPDEARWLGLGTTPGLEAYILDYRNGRDLMAQPRGVMVVDLFGLCGSEARNRFPQVFQWLMERVKPARDGQAAKSPTNDAKEYARLWWQLGKPRTELRLALNGLRRFISTVETSKHRVFVFLGASTRPDNMLVNVAVEDAFVLAVLSSRLHVAWASAAGGTLEDRPRYNKTRCFDPFPFPDPDEGVKARLRELGEQLDAHRKARAAAHPGLTLTQMYNVLEKLKAGEALTAKDREIHEQGLVAVLLDLHRRIDALVLGAYGWPADLDEAALLERLVALNAERATEERAGHVRWLRPEFQAPRAAAGKKAVQEEMGMAPAAVVLAGASWPRKLPERFQAVKAMLAGAEGAIDAKLAAKAFKGAKRQEIEQVLETLVAFGEAQSLGDGRFAA